MSKQLGLLFEFIPQARGTIHYHKMSIHEKINWRSHAKHLNHWNNFFKACSEFMILFSDEYIFMPFRPYVDYPYWPDGTKWIWQLSERQREMTMAKWQGRHWEKDNSNMNHWHWHLNN